MISERILYIVVGGDGESNIYPKLIKYINKAINITNDVDDNSPNCAFIISGGSFPNYYDIIDSGIEDAIEYKFDRIIVAIDSENMAYSDKRKEIIKHMEEQNTSLDYRVIVQHFCLETWALGPQNIILKRFDSPKLVEYRKLFDVSALDPEDLPDYPQEELNRAQFALQYLKKIIMSDITTEPIQREIQVLLIRKTIFVKSEHATRKRTILRASMTFYLRFRFH